MHRGMTAARRLLLIGTGVAVLILGSTGSALAITETLQPLPEAACNEGTGHARADTPAGTFGQMSRFRLAHLHYVDSEWACWHYNQEFPEYTFPF